jgi:RNA polymerase sigma-70 factor (ECF subfamily)
MDDAAIIARVREGDTEAYALLVRKYHRGVLGRIHRLVGDAHLAEDIGQEVFLDAYKALPRFDLDRGTPFAAWLQALARNRCASALRARSRARLVAVEDAPDLPGDGPSPEERLLDLEESRALAASLACLGEPFRSTLRLHLGGKTLRDIACQDGVGMATVKTRLFRAREKLRRLLAASGGGVCHERQL